MSAIKTIAKAEIKSMLKERVLVLILILEFLLLTSSSLMSTGYELMTSPSTSRMGGYISGLNFIGIVTESRGTMASAARRAGVRYLMYPNVETALEDMSDGMIDAVVLGSVKDEPPSYFAVYLPENSPKMSLIQMSLRRLFSKLELNLRERNIRENNLDVNLISYDITNSRRPILYEIYLVFTLPLLIFMPALISGNLLMDSLTQDMESRELLNLSSAPISEKDILFGKALGAFIVGLSQMILWVLVLSLFMDINNFFSLILFGSLYMLFYIGCGGFLSLKFKMMRPTQSLYTLVILFSMVFMTPFFTKLGRFIEYSPSYVISHLAIGEGILGFTPQFIILSLIVLISFGISLRLKNNLRIL